MTAIYHIMHIDNLASIVEADRIWCDAERAQQGLSSVAIAYQELKTRRMQKSVPVAAGGVLAEYVPFYFATRSPMLSAIHSGRVAGYSGGQEAIIYLISSVERVIETAQPWCFTDGHAVETVSRYYERLEDLEQLDWEVIHNWSWRNIQSDLDRKRRKQ